MELSGIEPHPEYGAAFEIHSFRCALCGRTQSYTLRRRGPSHKAAPQPERLRRAR
jgi:hypothetical protein